MDGPDGFGGAMATIAIRSPERAASSTSSAVPSAESPSPPTASGMYGA